MLKGLHPGIPENICHKKSVTYRKKERKLRQNQTSVSGITGQKMKFSIKDFFSKRDQIRSFLRIWSYLLKKSLIENFMLFAVNVQLFWQIRKPKSIIFHTMAQRNIYVHKCVLHSFNKFSSGTCVLHSFNNFSSCTTLFQQIISSSSSI